MAAKTPRPAGIHRSSPADDTRGAPREHLEEVHLVVNALTPAMGTDEAHRDAVDGHAVRSDLPGQATDEANDPALARDVVQRARRAGVDHRAGDRDDPAPALLAHEPSPSSAF
jgi:hypothetical protein